MNNRPPPNNVTLNDWKPFIINMWSINSIPHQYLESMILKFTGDYIIEMPTSEFIILLFSLDKTGTTIEEENIFYRKII